MAKLAKSVGIDILLQKVLMNKSKIKELEEANEQILGSLPQSESFIVHSAEGYKTVEIGKPEGGWFKYRKFDLVKNTKTSEKDKKYYGLF